MMTHFQKLFKQNKANKQQQNQKFLMNQAFKGTKLNENTSWTRQAQNYIKQLAQEKMLDNWNEISKEVFKRCGKNHSGKQCRQRYINYIQFSNTSELREWSSKQEQLLFVKFKELGSKWSLIARFFPNKSQNCLKNKFYGAIRKLTRKLNSTGKLCKRIKKPIKFEALLKPFDLHSFTKQLNYADGSNFQNLKQKIIEAAKSDINQLSQETALDLINKINKFSLIARSLKPNKSYGRSLQYSRLIQKNDQKKEKKRPIESEQLQRIADKSQEISNQLCQAHSNYNVMFNDMIKKQDKEGIFDLVADLAFNEDCGRISKEDQLWPRQQQNDLDILFFH